MNRPTPTRTTRSRTRDHRETMAAIDALRARVTTLEQEHQLLRTTTRALARETGVTIGGPCSRCSRSYVLITTDTMHCPECGDGRSM